MSSNDEVCPKCGFKYMLVEHDTMEETEECVVCGYYSSIDQEDEDEDGENKKDINLPNPKVLKLAHLIKPVMEELWENPNEELKDDYCIVYQGLANGGSLCDNVFKYGLGGLVVHIFMNEDF